MRLPSLELVFAGASAAAKRFPLVIVCAVVAVVAGFILAGDESLNRPFETRLMATALLGLSLFFTLSLFGERRGFGLRGMVILRLTGLLFLVWFLFAWPGWAEPIAWTRWFQLMVGLHLLAAVLPYLLVDEFNGFWQYNRSLFLRFLMAAVFSVVLYAGLSIALLAIDNLLGVNVPDESYMRLWFIIAYLFNTWFFLAGVPDDFEALDRLDDYPRVLKVFAQFILVPIVAVYLVILTVYLGKVIVTREWPSGWIGYLVSSVSVLGILALLLVHPVRDREENRWVNTYARGFFIALLPSIVMLILAVWQRIEQYGITERRYFLIVLAVWLAAAATYYTVTRSKNIKLIPATLCAVAFFTFIGPWSAYPVSRNSQVDRLAGILQEGGLLADGSLRAAAGETSFEDRKEISAILRYLLEFHGTDALQPWFDTPLAEIDTIGGTSVARGAEQVDRRAQLVAARMGVEYVGRYQPPAEGVFNFYTDRRGSVVDVTGFNYAYTSTNLLDDILVVEGDSVLVDYFKPDGVVRLSVDGVAVLTAPLAPVLDNIRDYSGTGTRGLPPEVMRIEGTGDGLFAVFYINRLSGERRADGLEVSSARADLYLRTGEETSDGEPEAPDDDAETSR
jgi:hypothetical protein